tara:strand:+ start:415 stop:624 length:210 start_codon:yes stop_codon:yes gene_type:complete
MSRGRSYVVALGVDATSVFFQTISGHDRARDRATGIDLSLDLIGVAEKNNNLNLMHVDLPTNRLNSSKL